MTKQELIERVFKTKGLPPGTTKKTVALLVDSMFHELADYFVKSKLTRSATPRFAFPGFGTFTKRVRSERVGRNPKTGDRITIPQTTTLTFAPSQDLKELLNKK